MSDDLRPYLELATGRDWTEQFTIPNPLELFAEGDAELGDDRTFRGLATVYGNVIDAWIPTTFKRGAFADSIRDDMDRIVILRQHDPMALLGKPIELTETSRGLELIGRISETAPGDEALTLMRDGVLTEFSVGFDPIEWIIDEESPLNNGGPFRTITRAKLHEISIAVFARDSLARLLEVHAGDVAEWFAAHELAVPAELEARARGRLFFGGLERVFSAYPELPTREDLSENDMRAVLEASTFFSSAVAELELEADGGEELNDDGSESADDAAGTEEEADAEGADASGEASNEGGSQGAADDPDPFDPDSELVDAELELADLDLAQVTP